jgi:hypothetical protein
MGKLVCTVEMDKANGVSVKVENADAQITQTVVMDGDSVTLTVQGSSETSTIVQKADSIVIKCKDFTVDVTGKLTLKSAKASSWTSQDILKLDSTKDMTLKSGAKLTQTASSDAKLSSSTKVNVEAGTDLVAKGMKATLQATGGEAKVDGVTLKMSGKSKADLDAPMVKVAAKGKLGLESSGMAELKGSMTTVSGSMVKLG